ncbi:MAG TPA: murein L,D-transpeptidase family protein [Bauldia sp.]|nr:murein L,D-transpeptidase family protein [Bauldia sp.]
MRFGDLSLIRRVVLPGVAVLALAACTSESGVPKDIRPVSQKLVMQMKSEGMSETSPIFVRIFKEESQLEIWKQQDNGKYGLLKTYDICKWSGVLGPKIKEGDRQAPEGFYTVTPAQMNPNSSYYLSFNIGYPNSYDRAHGRTGTHIMVHGACSSAGCYSMTDEDAGEIFALARDAFKGGQREFQIQAFPFRMTPENIARHRGDPNMDFWMNLKEGYDHFEVTRQAPTVEVCNKRYVFNADSGGKPFNAAGACPTYAVPDWIATAVAAKQASDNEKIASLSSKMERDANQLAAQKQKVADQLAAQEQEVSADAARTPLLKRVFGKGDKNAEPDPLPETATALTETEPAATPAPAPKAAVSASPSPKPASQPGATADAEPIPATVDQTTTATTAAPNPEPTRKLTSDFDWPEDDVVAGSGKFLPSGLDVPPPTAN